MAPATAPFYLPSIAGKSGLQKEADISHVRHLTTAGKLAADLRCFSHKKSPPNAGFFVD